MMLNDDRQQIALISVTQNNQEKKISNREHVPGAKTQTQSQSFPLFPEQHKKRRESVTNHCTR
jgi:hypothetical protein